MRTLSRFGAVCAAASAVLLLGPAAHATPGGDNGTVKIHDASTGEELRRNEPHVCAFYLDAFGFDGGQQVDWHIDAIPPSENKGETVESGALTLDAQGHGRSEDLSLSDGHYKLFWNFEGEKGSAKHKVFWSDCEDEQEPGGATPSGSASVSASASPSSGASQGPSGEPGASASPSSSAGGGVPASSSPSSSPSPRSGADGDLAETGNGAPVGLLSGVAAALVAGGGFLVLRRRRPGRG
ncbi:LPXTG cell wall anchor domain-containing protein [Streptomyces violarus]|uniref:LPXTG-motif cell wall-anchored protein n=1 Tax=Streptomyces violarus TaxID=67380 RepID=A0A7W4ZX88_9ACTN|nr:MULTISPECIES: LPXTG cell wall anchor domain-containing protein [Streptomyces]MBB3080275.1 LPXTG-motif cell wall-anchored protein [Streptomyces violarus]WRU00712.1 LPXTG cell wall anchor domain-containing protein [Streptomyces sp. CGMCC 4.1772]